jgi:hypothetical protein
MKLDRAVSIQIELQGRIVDLISLARTFHLTHQEIMDRYHKLYERYPGDLPTHVREFARGYYTALIDNLYRTDLVFGYLWGNILYTKFEDYPPALRQQLRCDVDTVTHGHFWKDTLVSGKNRTFFVPGNATAAAVGSQSILTGGNHE